MVVLHLGGVHSHTSEVSLALYLTSGIYSVGWTINKDPSLGKDDPGSFSRSRIETKAGFLALIML